MIHYKNEKQKLPKNVGRFGQIKCCQRLQKVAQSPKIARSGHTAYKVSANQFQQQKQRTQGLPNMKDKLRFIVYKE